MGGRLGHAHEPRLEDRQGHVRGEAPVPHAHHARARPNRHSVPVAHVLLGRPVVPAVLDELADRDAVRDQRDVEAEQPGRGEPERCVRQAVARERPPDHAGQHVPAHAGRDEGAAAHDHHVRVGEVAHEVARVPRPRLPLSGPGQVLDDHVQRAQCQERRSRDEVLGELAVVRRELVVGVGLGPNRWCATRQQADRREDHHREVGDVDQELQRGDVLQVHGPPAQRSPGSTK